VIATAQAPDQVRAVDGARVPAADVGAFVERDRRAGAERIIELGRWLVLIFAAISVNFPAPNTAQIGAVNGVLGLWALFNLAVTISLFTDRLPSKRMQYAMTGVDIGVVTTLVSLTGGFGSTFGITFFAVVIASSIRFGLLGSLCCVLVVAVFDLLSGFVVSHVLTPAALNAYLAHIFLYLIIALTSSLLARELVSSRARQMEHTYRLEHAAFFELREVDRMKSEFIMLASHELRTPLAKVKAWLALIQDAGDRLPPQAHAEGLEVLRSESEHLARLTDNLLCIAQLEAGEIRIKTGPVNTQQVFDQVLSRFVENINRGRCRASIDEGARIVLADREKLALALACLVDNALKFSPPDEPVTVTACVDGTSVRIDVSDHGRRIPEEQRERVFQSFYQMESPLMRQRGGAGVGLYLARQLVERMGGRIWIEAPRARGNIFSISLQRDL
jgi:signal transduction histidine kinase